eukprot:Gb_31617 [translate_table: standard]
MFVGRVFALLAVVILLIHIQGGKCARMKLIHRHSIDSPFYRQFPSRHAMIHELLHMDSLRSIVPPSALSPSSAAEAPQSSSNLQHNPFSAPLASAATLGSALYFVELYIGTPPQKALLVADTGSDLIWVKCNPCANCSADFFPSFDPQNSSSLVYVPCFSRDCYAVSPSLTCIFKPAIICKYRYGYLDNSSTSGPYIRETVTMNSTSGKQLKAEKVFMGCGTENEGQTKTSLAGGVLGLGQGFNSFATQTASLYGAKFSYCLGDYLDPVTVKNSLVFGDIIDEESSMLREPIQYTPILKNQHSGYSFYYVGIEEIAINGEILPISRSVWEIDEAGHGGAIVDSGTSLSYFVEEAYEIILEALSVAITYPKASTSSPQQFDLCFNTTGVNDLKFPQISIGLKGGATFSPPPENFILEIEEGVRCVGFRPIDEASTSIIGSLLQQNFFVQFDRDRSILGFGRADCSSHK